MPHLALEDEVPHQPNGGLDGPHGQNAAAARLNLVHGVPPAPLRP